MSSNCKKKRYIHFPISILNGIHTHTKYKHLSKLFTNFQEIADLIHQLSMPIEQVADLLTDSNENKVTKQSGDENENSCNRVRDIKSKLKWG